MRKKIIGSLVVPLFVFMIFVNQGFAQSEVRMSKLKVNLLHNIGEFEFRALNIVPSGLQVTIAWHDDAEMRWDIIQPRLFNYVYTMFERNQVIDSVYIQPHYRAPADFIMKDDTSAVVGVIMLDLDPTTIKAEELKSGVYVIPARFIVQYENKATPPEFINGRIHITLDSAGLLNITFDCKK